MSVEISDIEHVRVIKVCTTRFDGSYASRFREATIDAVPPDRQVFVVDLGNVTSIDSTGIGELVHLMKRIGRQGSMQLCSVSPMVLKVFRLTRLDGVFSIHKSLQECLGAQSINQRKVG